MYLEVAICGRSGLHLQGPKRLPRGSGPTNMGKTPTLKGSKTPQRILLMEEILHQLIGRLFHYLQGFSTIPGGAGFLPLTVGSTSYFCFLRTSRKFENSLGGFSLAIQCSWCFLWQFARGLVVWNSRDGWMKSFLDIHVEAHGFLLSNIFCYISYVFICARV